MKLTGLLFFFATILCSCNGSSGQIEKLQKENEELRSKLTLLQHQDSDNEYSAIAIVNKSQIKLGEQYMADIRLAVVDTKNPPTVILTDLINGEHIPTGDTLKYSDEYQCSLYRLTPKDIGEHKWSGIVLQTIDGQVKQFPFTVTYTVVK